MIAGDRLAKAKLLVIGLLTFVLFAVPGLEKVKIGNVELKEFAQPRLVLALLVLYSLHSLFDGLYRHISAARAKGVRTILRFDPLSEELIRKSTNTGPAATFEVLELGMIATKLKQAADITVFLLVVFLLSLLAIAVAWQLSDVLGPAVAAALSGDGGMQAVVVVAAGLAVAAAVRVASCFVLIFAPRRTGKFRVPYFVRWAMYKGEKARLRTVVESNLRKAESLLEEPDRSAVFRTEFKRNRIEISLFCSEIGILDPERLPDDLRSFDAFSLLQEWTLTKVVAAYLVEYVALDTTKGLAPFAVVVKPTKEERSDDIAMMMIECGARELTPPDHMDVPEPIRSLVLEARVPNKSAD